MKKWERELDKVTDHAGLVTADDMVIRKIITLAQKAAVRARRPKCGRVWGPLFQGPCICANEKPIATTTTGADYIPFVPSDAKTTDGKCK
jgi:hypothetical protein